MRKEKNQEKMLNFSVQNYSGQSNFDTKKGFKSHIISVERKFQQSLDSLQTVVADKIEIFSEKVYIQDQQLIDLNSKLNEFKLKFKLKQAKYNLLNDNIDKFK